MNFSIKAQAEMNFIFKVIAAHIVAAVQENWKTTLAGIIVAIIGVLQASIPLIEGHPIDQIDWASIGTKLVTAIGLVLAKDITIMDVVKGAPRAEPVKKP